MKLITLVENTQGSTACGAEHGLSIYIETENHCLLMDTGASELFSKNAELLGIDLTKIDTVILSHGHHDHGGGLPLMSQLAPSAEIYLQENALDDYYGLKTGTPEYIGINKQISSLPQCKKLNGNLRIDKELYLFTGISGNRYPCKGNLILKKMVNHELIQDSFDHEQCLILQAEGHDILLSGCAHNGILNILDTYHSLMGSYPAAVISGFHMANLTGAPLTEAEKKNILDIAAELKAIPTTYFTGHCTGAEAFQLMKPILGEQLQALHSGDEICLSL